MPVRSEEAFVLKWFVKGDEICSSIVCACVEHERWKGFLGATAVETSQSSSVSFRAVPLILLNHTASLSRSIVASSIREITHFFVTMQILGLKRVRTDSLLGPEFRKRDKKSVVASPDATAIVPHFTHFHMTSLVFGIDRASYRRITR